MDVILLERIAKLGHMGDTVSVKAGYARNYLLPQGKALRANKANMAHFETQRSDLEARNAERKKDAEGVAANLNGNTYIAVRSAGETGQLYGSVAARDIAATLDDAGFSVGRGQIELMNPIKIIGLHTVTVILHPEVEAEVVMNVARSEDEAVRQAAGEDLTSRDAIDGVEADEDEINIDDVFENADDMEVDEDGNVVEASDDEAETDAEEQAENMTMGDEAQLDDADKA